MAMIFLILLSSLKFFVIRFQQILTKTRCVWVQFTDRRVLQDVIENRERGSV